jgi:hypothetical protein
MAINGQVILAEVEQTQAGHYALTYPRRLGFGLANSVVSLSWRTGVRGPEGTDSCKSPPFAVYVARIAIRRVGTTARPAQRAATLREDTPRPCNGIDALSLASGYRSIHVGWLISTRHCDAKSSPVARGPASGSCSIRASLIGRLH